MDKYYFIPKGIVAPIKVKSSSVDGLPSTTGIGGKEAQELEENEKYHESDEIVTEVTRERRRLNVEIEQTSEILAKQAENAEREQQIEDELKSINREFYCEWCDKQYKNVSEV